ncbi:putative virion structural protein [Salmonella phage SPFM10]|nr:putative virion structural protein [Salmonella phage SPFM10]
MPDYIYSYGVDCTAIAAFLKVQAQTKLDGLVYPDGPSEAKGQGIPVKIGAKPQVGERLSLVVTPAPVDHVITFKEDCYAYLGSVPAAIPENTNPPLTNPNDPDTDLLTTLNTQYGLKLTEDDIGSALFRNVTAYLDVKLPKTTTAKKNSGYIGTQDVTYNRLELGTPTPISDEGADRNTSMTLVLDFINEKNPDAELELSKITD